MHEQGSPRGVRALSRAGERGRPQARLQPLALLSLCIAVACGHERAGQAPVAGGMLGPASPVVAAGDTLRFHVTGSSIPGARIASSVVFVAQGGSITKDGLYRAGLVPGIFPLIASVPARAWADTSVVLIVRPRARTYRTRFPSRENPIAEGGAWIGGGRVGLDWTDVSTESGYAIGHQTGASYTDATALLTGAWAPGQMVSATVRAVGGPSEACYPELELRLRSSLAAHRSTGYEIAFKVSPGPDAYLIIVRWNGRLGDFTYLTKREGSGFGVKDGDVVSARVTGRVIEAYRNGVELAQATDSVFAGGSPGMGFNLENGLPGCSGTNSTYGFSSFFAADGL